jgi:glyoxylase-like metal-dependent hydrolase (beta-lactamase superfamily II)
MWHFHDPRSGTLTHLLACPATGRAALIDPVLGFDPGSALTNTCAAEHIAALIRAESLALDWVLETHIHADHLSAAQFFKTRFGAKLGIGERVREVRRLHAPLFNRSHEPIGTTPVFDRLWRDGDQFSIGTLDANVLSTPGHTLDGVTYRIGRHAFVGDTVFRPDFGTARTDLLGGDASALFRSIVRLYALPRDTVLHLCHDYPRSSASVTKQVCVEHMRTHNIHLSMATSESDFVALRRARDATLPVPDLLVPAVQFNAGGCLPDPADTIVADLSSGPGQEEMVERR